jgi:phage terminase large subunit GpA-like protein
MSNERLPVAHFRKLLPEAQARLKEVVVATCKAIFTPEPFEPADTWAEGNIELPPEVSEQGGYVRLFGFQRELVLAPFEPGVRVVTVMKSARVGFTLLMAILLLYVAAKRKFDAFLAQPIASDAHEFHDDFLQPIINHSRTLAPLKRVHVRGGIQDRWYKFRLITGAAIRLVGAQKADVFRRFKAFIGILDEVDAKAYGSTREDDQGNKIELAERRLDTYPGSALVIGGTPTDLKTSRLVKYFDMSEQRRYFWPCQRCGAFQYLIWGDRASPTGFKWTLDETTGEVRDVHYKCLHCGGRMEEDEKAVMDQQGEWRVTRPGKRSGYRAYHIWEAYGFNPKSTWTVIVERFLEAVRSGDMQPFVNLSLGEPHEDRSGIRLEPHMLAAHCRPYEAEVPGDVIDWTWGVDTQKGSSKENSDGSLIAPQRHEAAAWGWGPGNKPILLGYFVLPFEGEPFVGESAAKLDALLFRKFTRKDGTEVPMAAAFLDGGHAQDAAIAYVKARVELGWEALHVVRGSKSNDPHAPVIMTRKGKSNRTGDEFFWLNLRPAKDHLDRLLKVQTPGPRYVEFPESMRGNEAFFSGLLNETLRPERKGGALRWLKEGSATGEPWDTLVYAYAAQIRAQQMYQAIDRKVGEARSPFSVTTPEADGVVQTYDGPDRSAMADKSEQRGLVAPTRSQPPQTAARVQRGNVPAGVPQQAQELGSLQRRGPVRARKSSVY